MIFPNISNKYYLPFYSNLHVRRTHFRKRSFYSSSGILEKAMAPHSTTLAWKIPWTEEPGGLKSLGSLELDTTEQLHFHFSLSCIGEGNGNPLQCSCLENPRDGEAWWAAVYGVAQSQTRLMRLSSSMGFPGEGNGTPLQDFCLENPMDGGA